MESKIFSLLGIFAVHLFLGQHAFAASTNGTSSASIVTPITITAPTALAFGKIAASTTAGTVLISTTGVRSKTGGVTLVSTGSTQNAAVFNVTGDPSATYVISLPTSATITSGANSMTVNAFVSNPSGSGSLNTTGNQSVTVGGTLNVGASQVGGTYTGVFAFTADYN